MGKAHYQQRYINGKVHYCALGALIEARNKEYSPNILEAAISALGFAALYEQVGPLPQITTWNNRQKSKRPVLARFDQAIEHQRALAMMDALSRSGPIKPG